MSPVSALPPPTGKPVVYALHADAWAEQARRHERHRVEQRRRRRSIARRIAGASGVIGVAGLAVFVVFVTGGDVPEPTIDTVRAEADAGDAADDGALGATPTSIDGSDTGGGADVVAADERTETAEVIDVWLLDRGDGSFEWGAVLSSNADVVRGDLEVSMVAFDDDGLDVVAEQLTVPRLAPGRAAAVGGVFEADEGTPTRLEVTSTLGSALPDEIGAVVALSDVRRVASGQIDRDDRLVGTVELTAGTGAPVRLTAIWRDDGGDVIASVFDVVGPVDADEAVDFSLSLPRKLVPRGEPDTIIASVGAVD